MESRKQSSSASLTSGRSNSMEIDNIATMKDSSGSQSPFLNEVDHDDSLHDIDADKGIVVDAPTRQSHVTTVPMAVSTPESLSEGVSSPASLSEEDDSTAFAIRNKRKRDSAFTESEPSFLYSNGSPAPGPTHTPVNGNGMTTKRPKGNHPKVRGVPIGVWRDSSERDDNDKHVIYGFIDVHDRLRTRIYALDRRGNTLIGNVPTGAGGCWVTFERIIFDGFIRDCNAAEIKEYVKLRSQMPIEANDQQIEAGNIATLVRAKAHVASLAPDSNTSIRATVPRATGPRGPYAPRNPLPRAPRHSSGFQAVNGNGNGTMNGHDANVQPHQSPSSDPRSNPMSVLLGYWCDSSEAKVADKHAVYGVLSGTDCFRVKVQRITRDGRYVDGNFPVGAGALWLHYEKVVLDPHIAHLDRVEIKEYCRIRQVEQQLPETPEERRQNELNAAQRAQDIVAAANAGANSSTPRAFNGNGTPNGTTTNINSRDDPMDESPPPPRRAEPRLSLRQHNDAMAEAERVRKDKAAALALQHEKTREKIAIEESAVREAAKMELNHNLKKLNRVWQAQQAATTEPTRASSMSVSGMGGVVENSNEVKFYNGIKYERKSTGPFSQKLTSAPSIITIDGEDYVEYRVLTKPSFF